MAIASEMGSEKLLVAEGVASGSGAGVVVSGFEDEVPARVTVIDPMIRWSSKSPRLLYSQITILATRAPTV